MGDVNKALKGWRTVLFNMFALLISILPQFFPQLKELLPEKFYLWVVLIVGILNIMLRSITNTPMGRSSNE